MNEQKVLIVDDEELVREILADTLADAGYTICEAGGAKEALRILEKERIQVMIFDLRMPTMNGVDLCAQVKKHYPASVIFAMSGYRSLFELVDCLSAGFEDYFAKPFNLSLIKQEIDHSFEKLKRWKNL